MPNKSDSAGKLHQYYTAISLQEKSNCSITSPLTDENEREKHKKSFEKDKGSLKSLKKIDRLTANYIISKPKSNKNIKCVEDIGNSSGANKINNTDDLKITFDDIASYNINKEKVEYNYIEKIDDKDTFDTGIRGNDSVIIKTTEYEIGFRYKFESGITSSIKLVGDYKKK